MLVHEILGQTWAGLNPQTGLGYRVSGLAVRIPTTGVIAQGSVWGLKFSAGSVCFLRLSI